MKHLKFFIFLCILSFTVSCGQQKRYIQYKVKKGETMSQIAQKLNMDTSTLLRLNPDIVGEPKPNSFIVVPEKKLEDFKSATKDDKNVEEKSDTITKEVIIDDENTFLENLKKNFEIYEVKKGDTFYNIEKRFGLNRQQLLLLNPELEEGLKLGMVLKIREIVKEVAEDGELYTDEIKRNIDLKIALLLPFKTYKYQVDSISLKDIFIKDAALVNIATDFYLGAEIAVDSLRNKGVNIQLNVFDTGDRGTEDINNIIRNKDIESHDAIIGPLYSDEAETIASKVDVPIVFPVYSKNQSTFSYSNLIKTSPDKGYFKEALKTYIKDNFIDGNLIIVSDNSFESSQTSAMLQSDLQRSTNALVTVLTPDKGYIAKNRFLQVLKPNSKNWVIMASNNQVIVSDVVNSLISLPEDTTARIFTFDKGAIYDRIDNTKLAKLQFTFVSDEYVDENAYETKTFNSQYIRKNNTLPSYYATKGFDITYDILIRLASGKKLKRTFDQGISKRVESKFDYRDSGSVPENKGVFIIKYNADLSLTKLK